MGESKQRDAAVTGPVQPRVITGGEALTYGTSFDEVLTELMAIRDMSVGDVAQRVPCTAGHISNLTNATEEPTRHTASRLDEVLKAGGRLLEIVDNSRSGSMRTTAISQEESAVYPEGLSLRLPFVPGRLVIEISGAVRSQNLGGSNLAVERGDFHEPE